jgi:hypothetical protein
MFKGDVGECPSNVDADPNFSAAHRLPHGNCPEPGFRAVSVWIAAVSSFPATSAIGLVNSLLRICCELQRADV